MALLEQIRSASRRWLPVLLALVLCVGAAGCGGDDDSTAETAPGTTGPGSATTVPEVQEAQLAEAAEQLAEAGLRAGVNYVPAVEPRGRVVGQERPPGTPMQRGDVVPLSVSIGQNPPQKVTVPNVTGTEAEGRGILEAAGFEVLTIPVPAVTDDVVVSISPPAADRIPRGSLVLLYAGG